jgi:hypothetical protein
VTGVRLSKDNVKAYVKQRFPRLVSCLRYLLRQQWRVGSVQEKFHRIYQRNAWASGESVSGPGSEVAQTEVIRNALPAILDELGAGSLLDVPCGDFNWMRYVNLGRVVYLGGDVVPELVTRNSVKFGSSERRFFVIDICAEALPEADVLLCRDCLVHLSFRDIKRALVNVRRSKVKFLLTTTFTSVRRNRDIFTGEWRPLNLRGRPFLFPEPLLLLNENCPQPGHSDKSIGLWQVSLL